MNYLSCLSFVVVLLVSGVDVYGAKVTVVCDTDIGSDFDDSFAVGYLLSRPDIFDFKLVVSATFNTTGKAMILAKYLEDAGRSDVDVGIGIPTPGSGTYRGTGYLWPYVATRPLEYKGNLHADGVKAMYDVVQAYGTRTSPVFIVGLAPFDNIAALLEMDSTISSKIRVVAMTGSIHHGACSPTSPPSREYNTFGNITASKILYSTNYSLPMCTAPSDTSGALQILGEAYQDLRQTRHNPTSFPVASALMTQYEIWYTNGGFTHGSCIPFSLENGTSPLYDLEAALLAGFLAETHTNSLPTVPDLLLQADRIYVDDQGNTKITSNSSIPVSWPAVSWKTNTSMADLAAFATSKLLANPHETFSNAKL